MNDRTRNSRPHVTSQRQERYLCLIPLRNRMITAEDTVRRTPGLANVRITQNRSLTVILTEPWHRRSCENSNFQNGKLFTFDVSTINDRRWFKCLIRSSKTQSRVTISRLMIRLRQTDRTTDRPVTAGHVWRHNVETDMFALFTFEAVCVPHGCGTHHNVHR
jgi:hypothetical protein